ncbi:glycosyltransferase family 61 protein [Hymenobacter cavernae]|nr:glycosyltransferase family 61 protein [Hymenobacter cavernae]
MHLAYNKLRINTFDKLAFPEKLFKDQDFSIRRDDHPFRFVQVEKTHLDARLRHQIQEWEKWTQDEYLLVYDKSCVIEPHAGWALTTDNQLIYPSLGFSRVEYLRKPLLEALRMRRQKLEEYEELISLRDTGEENYFHFYNDVLAKLFFLEEKLGLSSEVPVLISAKLYQRPVFQYFMQHPYLRERKWVVQGEQYIRSHKTYFCKPLTHTAHYYDRIRALVQPHDLLTAGPERRIFITRSPKRLRFIENGAQAEQVCRELGFEIVDFDTLSLPEQIQLMSQARYVIGIHGAGLTNMLFRGRQPMGLLEIYPPGDYYPFHYVLMATQLGYDYNGLIGSAGQQQYSGGFHVDVEELRQRATALLQR